MTPRSERTLAVRRRRRKHKAAKRVTRVGDRPEEDDANLLTEWWDIQDNITAGFFV